MEEYFQTLFGNYESESGLVELRAFRPEWAQARDKNNLAARYWFPLNPQGLQQAQETVQKWARTYAVYVGVLPRNARAGGANAVTQAGVLWADIDGGTGGVSEALSLFKEAIRAGRLITPDLLVKSGGGIHAYWRLAEVAPLPDDTARQEYKGLLQRIALAIGGKAPQAHGDPACADVARVLRPVGTWNRKRKEEPRDVETLHCAPADVLTLSEWLSLLPPPFRPPKPYSPPIAPYDLRGYVGLWRWAGKPITEGERHNTLTSAARWLLRDVGVPESIARELLAAKAAASAGREPISACELERILRWGK